MSSFSCNMIQPDKIRILDQLAGGNVLTKSKYIIPGMGLVIILTKLKYKIQYSFKTHINNQIQKKKKKKNMKVQILETPWCCCCTIRALELWLRTPELWTHPALSQTGHPAFCSIHFPSISLGFGFGEQLKMKWKVKFKVQMSAKPWCCCCSSRAPESWLQTPELRTYPALTQTGHPSVGALTRNSFSELTQHLPRLTQTLPGHPTCYSIHFLWFWFWFRFWWSIENQMKSKYKFQRSPSVVAVQAEFQSQTGHPAFCSIQKETTEQRMASGGEKQVYRKIFIY